MLPLVRVLQEPIEFGGFDGQQSPENLAKFLMTGIYGLRVLNKTQPAIRTLHSGANAAKSAEEGSGRGNNDAGRRLRRRARSVARGFSHYKLIPKGYIDLISPRFPASHFVK